MQRRVFIVILVILGVIAVAAGIFVVVSSQPGDTVQETPNEETGDPNATPTPILVPVVVARQNIPRGVQFTESMLGERLDPQEKVPDGVISDISRAIGRVAEAPIRQGNYIFEADLREQSAGLTGEAAFDIPPGHVMVAFPINKLTSVAYAIKPGDVVDVLMTFSIVDIDPEFQTLLPNKFAFLSREIDEDGNVTLSLEGERVKGRLNIENIDFPGFEFPREETQRPRRVAQLIVQKAIVIGVGPWLEDTASQPVPTEEDTGEAPPPEPVILPDVASLAVTPQDALVLLWARRTGIYTELALRAATDAEADHSTEAVTLQYMLTRFNIAIPPKIEFSIEQIVEPTVTPRPNEPAPG